MKKLLNLTSDTIIQCTEIALKNGSDIDFIEPEEGKKQGLANHKWAVQNIYMYVQEYNTNGVPAEIKRIYLSEKDIETIYNEMQAIKQERFVCEYTPYSGF